MTNHRPVALGAAAVLGLGSLFIASPAMADDTSAQDQTTQQDVQAVSQSVAAPTDTAIAAAAASLETTPEDVRAQLAAQEIAVAPTGHVAFTDPAVHGVEHGSDAFDALALPADRTPETGSRPGAPVTLYIDFDGAVIENSAWNLEGDGYGAQARYDLPGAPTINQAQVWARVAEDYAPFNVNVTTSDPGEDALYKSSASDNTYGSHVVVTDVTPQFGEGSGGIAWVGGTGSEFLSPALAFTEGAGDDAKAIADVVSHEAGHNFGLAHDGYLIEGDPEASEYYMPTGGLWGPIMGAPYNSPLSQWSNGDYAEATNHEDDLSIITDRSVAGPIFIGWTYENGELYTETGACVPDGVDPDNPAPGDVIYALNEGGCNPPGAALSQRHDFIDRADFIADDHGDDAAGATVLDNADDSFSAEGTISTASDVDVFKLTTLGGTLEASVDVAAIGPNLDATLTLTDAEGAQVAWSAPETTLVGTEAEGLDAEISTEVEAGVYYLNIDGIGEGDPSAATPAAANGYTDYGSLGNYTLSGSAAAFDPAPVVIESPADGTEVAAGGAVLEVSGTAESEAVVTIDANGVIATANASAAGEWSTDIVAAVAGKTTIVASQTVDGIPVDATDSVTVIAPVAAPGIDEPPAETTATPTFSGTGIAGAEVAVTVVDASGTETVLTTVVGDDGTWSVTASALAAGAYTATATQTFNDVTSGASAEVAFEVVIPDNGGTDPESEGDTTGGGNGSTGPGAGVNASGDANGAGALASTGAEFDFAPMLALTTLALLVAGGVFAAVAIRQRKRAEA